MREKILQAIRKFQIETYLVTEKTSGCQYALKELRNRNKKRNHVSLVRFK